MLSRPLRTPRPDGFRWCLLLAASVGCQFESSGTGRVGVASVGGAGGGGGTRQNTSTRVEGGIIGTGARDTSTTVAAGGVTTSTTQADGTAGVGATASCITDEDCPDSTRRCDTGSRKCVTCLRNSDCAPGSACADDVCTARIGCQRDIDCSGTDWPFCDLERGFCVRCKSSADCPLGHECLENRCEAFVGCAANVDCPNGLVCLESRARCAECNVALGCPRADQVCRAGVCRGVCASDADCSAPTARCDVTTGACIPCIAPADCRANEYCSAGECVTDRCSAGESRCEGSAVAVCNDVGDGYLPAQACPPGQACSARLGHAACVASGSAGAAGTGGTGGSSNLAQGGSAAATSGTGGSHTGGSQSASSTRGGTSSMPDTLERGGRPSRDGTAGMAGIAGMAGMAGMAGNAPVDCPIALVAAPCDFLPKYTGLQVVDGYADDFCNVPAFELNFSNAEKVIEYTNPAFSGYPERAIARVAWSESYVHVFVRVEDPFIETADKIEYIYGADSIELMITADESVTGNPVNDPSAMHIISGPWATSDWGMAANALPSKVALPWEQYAVATDAKGYNVELRVPWPNGMTVDSTMRVYFDLALNAAVKDIRGQVDVRDAQAIYHMGAAPGTCGEPYCDDRLWCRTRLD